MCTGSQMRYNLVQNLCTPVGFPLNFALKRWMLSFEFLLAPQSTNGSRYHVYESGSALFSWTSLESFALNVTGGDWHVSAEFENWRTFPTKWRLQIRVEENTRNGCRKSWFLSHLSNTSILYYRHNLSLDIHRYVHLLWKIHSSRVSNTAVSDPDRSHL